jgi:SAM-dependent methyltransferase
MICKKQNKCRICYSKDLKEIISFGKVPLNGNLLSTKKTRVDNYKLNLVVCESCYHVQIGYLVNPKKLFSKYFWETGISQSNINLIGKLYNKLKKEYNLQKKSKVFEIACNDASLLKYFFKKNGCFVSGIDPAKNLLNKNIKKKFRVINDFFNIENSSKFYKNSKFDYIIARNVLAHVEDPNEIFGGAKNISKEGTFFVIEVPHLLTIYDENQYDNIFHEHVGYHSLHSLDMLASKYNFQLYDCEIIESQGKSIRCFYKYSVNKVTKTKMAIEIKKSEKKLLTKQTWLRFAHKIKKHNTKMRKLFQSIKNKGKNISAYGASGKGQSLLQICKLNEKYIDYIYDKSELKINKFSPYGKIKIINPAKINFHKPDYLLLLTWNLEKEIINQENEFVSKGGKFIIPFPSPKII